MAKCSKFIKPATCAFLTPEVVAAKRISPSFVRVTIGGPALREFRPMGFDQWFRLFLPNNGVLRLPTTTKNLWAQYMNMSPDTQPLVRNYTVREYRTEGLFSDGPELDVDFVRHADANGELGPAAAWADSARPGDELAILDEGIIYQPPRNASWQLLAGDETALPAILGILRDAPRDLRAQVFLEIPEHDDTQETYAPEGVTITWLPRDEKAPTALEAVQNAELPQGQGYAFLAGGQQLVTELRRHLVHDRGFGKRSVTFTGYWR